MKELGGAAGLRLHFVGMHAVQETADGVRAIGVVVGERRAVVLGIPALAGRDAGVTADTGVEVDDKAERFLGVFRKAGHVLTFCATSAGALPTGLF